MTGAAPPGLDERHRRLLSLLAAASFFEGYDLNVVMVALPHIRHTFHLSQATASAWLALLYLGALPATVLARQADRYGRRRLLLVSITGYTLATAATALSPTIVAFGVSQMLARLFLVLEVSLTWTVLAEEFPAHLRGYGFGVLAMLDALGAGAGALLFGLVLTPLGLSWRALYVAALPVLVVVAVMRRRLPETDRFLHAAATHRLARRAGLLLTRPHRRRITVIAAASLTGALLTQSTVFVIDFMQTQRHISTGTASLVLIAAGAVAIPVLVASGTLSDRYGRKRVGCTFLTLSITGPLLFFLAARSTAALFACLALTYIGQFGSWPTLGGLSVELFPTSLRALSRSIGNGATLAGQALSFVLASMLIHALGGIGPSVVVLSAGPVVSLVLLARGLPETAGRPLDEINPDDLAIPEPHAAVDITDPPPATALA